jgi:hypothetical protein
MHMPNQGFCFKQSHFKYLHKLDSKSRQYNPIKELFSNETTDGSTWSGIEIQLLQIGFEVLLTQNKAKKKIIPTLAPLENQKRKGYHRFLGLGKLKRSTIPLACK